MTDKNSGLPKIIRVERQPYGLADPAFQSADYAQGHAAAYAEVIEQLESLILFRQGAPKRDPEADMKFALSCILDVQRKPQWDMH